MTAPIVDPTNPHVAIMPSGRLGASVSFLPAVKDPTAVTTRELETGTIIGYAEPEDVK